MPKLNDYTLVLEFTDPARPTQVDDVMADDPWRAIVAAFGSHIAGLAEREIGRAQHPRVTRFIHPNFTILVVQHG